MENSRPPGGQQDSRDAPEDPYGCPIASLLSVADDARDEPAASSQQVNRIPLSVCLRHRTLIAARLANLLTTSLEQMRDMAQAQPDDALDVSEGAASNMRGLAVPRLRLEDEETLEQTETVANTFTAPNIPPSYSWQPFGQPVAFGFTLTNYYQAPYPPISAGYGYQAPLPSTFALPAFGAVNSTFEYVPPPPAPFVPQTTWSHPFPNVGSLPLFSFHPIAAPPPPPPPTPAPQVPPTHPSLQRQSRFFRLPRELRDMVYDELYTIDSDLEWILSIDDEQNRVRNDRDRLAFLLTCRIANVEAGPVHYMRNHLTIASNGWANRIPAFHQQSGSSITWGLSMPRWFMRETSRARLQQVRSLTVTEDRFMNNLQLGLARLGSLSGLRELDVYFDNSIGFRIRDLEADKVWLQWMVAQFPALHTFTMEYEFWPYNEDEEDVQWDELGLRSVTIRERP